MLMFSLWGVFTAIDFPADDPFLWSKGVPQSQTQSEAVKVRFRPQCQIRKSLRCCRLKSSVNRKLMALCEVRGRTVLKSEKISTIFHQCLTIWKGRQIMTMRCVNAFAVSNAFSEFRKFLNPQVNILNTCKNWHSLFHRERQPESFYGPRGRRPRPRLLLEAQRLGLTTFILQHRPVAEWRRPTFHEYKRMTKQLSTCYPRTSLSLSLSLKEWRSIHLHDMRPTNAIATRNNRVASENRHILDGAVSKREWAEFSVSVKPALTFNWQRLLTMTSAYFNCNFDWLSRQAQRPAPTLQPSSWWKCPLPRETQSNQKIWIKNMTRVSQKHSKTTNQNHRLGQTSSVFERNDVVRSFPIHPLCQPCPCFWLGTITSYHVSSCPAMFYSFHLCSYPFMLLCINDDVSWVPSCLIMLSGVSSCHVMLYPVSLVFLRVFLCNAFPLMPSDAFWRWWVIVAHDSPFLLGSFFWKVFFGHNSKDSKAEMEFVQKNNHEKQELNAECKKMHTMGDKAKAAKRNDLYLATMKCTWIQTWITFTRYTIHGSAGACFQQSTKYQPEHARRTCKQYIISSWKAI